MGNALHELVGMRDMERLCTEIESGTGINEQDGQGRTPLMKAVYNRDFDIAKALIDAGADVNIQDEMQSSPFLHAAAEGDTGILELCIGAGADVEVTNRYGGTALIPAAERGHVDIVRILLEQTAVDVNHVNKLGWTALLEAVILGDGSKNGTEVVRLLVNSGANVNLADRDGATPLVHARKQGYGEIEGLLLAVGAR